MLEDMRKSSNLAAMFVAGILIIVLLLLSLACCNAQEFFDAVDGFTATPTATATPGVCVPQCITLCEEIQEKHGNPPEVCVADCESVCQD